MFIRFSHKVKRVATKHQKISLCLGYVAFLILLTTIAYFIPKVAIIVLGVISGVAVLLLFTADRLGKQDYNLVKSWGTLLTALFISILIIGAGLEMFHGYNFLNGRSTYRILRLYYLER